MKVAAYQAPLLPSGSMAAIELIRERVQWCEANGVEFLCCPEAILGGLADQAEQPAGLAIDVESGQLESILQPLASNRVTTIVGFTEKGTAGDIYNSAAIFHHGAIHGLYRKRHPAIRRSVYQPGDRTPVFTLNGVTFGIIICNDSNFPELARDMRSQGARLLFVASNNALPPHKAEVVAEARDIDMALATANGMTVIRADVAGTCGDLVADGCSIIVDPRGHVLSEGTRLQPGLLVADCAMAQSRQPSSVSNE